MLTAVIWRTLPCRGPDLTRQDLPWDLRAGFLSGKPLGQRVLPSENTSSTHRSTSEPIDDLDLVERMHRGGQACANPAPASQRRYLAETREAEDLPPWTQNIRSSMTTDRVRKSNMSVKYCQTAGLPYFRTHSE